LENAVLKSDEYSKILEDVLKKTDELENIVDRYFYKPEKSDYDPRYGKIYTYELSNGKKYSSTGEYYLGEEIEKGVYVVKQLKEKSIYEKIMEMYEAVKVIDKNKN
jgi:hypothetical protein